MDLSLADLSDNDDSEYEENGCHDQMWDKMNDVLQEDLAVQSTWMAETERIKAALENDHRKAELERLKKVEENINKEAQEKEFEKKRIRENPPGLRVFPHEPFLYFHPKTLSVKLTKETRDKLKAAEIIESDKFPAVTDPFKFILQLCPETSSPLIQNKDDFENVCDYLFKAQVSSADDNLREIYHKSLLDILGNYAYRSWQLRSDTIYDALFNLGADVALLVPEPYFKHTSNKSVHEEFKTKKMPTLKKKVEKIDPRDIGFSEEKLNEFRKQGLKDDQIIHRARLKCLKHLVKLLNHITSQYSSNTRVIYGSKKDNRRLLNSLIFCHILATISSFEDILSDFEVQFDVSMLFDTLFQSFPEKMWYTSSIEKSVISDLSEVIFFVGEIFEDDENPKNHLRPWTIDEVPRLNQMWRMDHHHNMVYRLSCLPDTRRGQEVRRTVAFMLLQRLVDPRMVECVSPADVSTVWDYLNQRREKLHLIERESYLSLNVLKLIDMIVGNDPRLDFHENNLESVKRLSDLLASFFRRAKSFQESTLATDLLNVQEFFFQLSAKWTTLSREVKSGRPFLRQQTLFQIEEKRKKLVRETSDPSSMDTP